MRIVVTGGGSGGHLSPALAVIQKIKELRPETEILYIGGKLSMEGTRQPSIEQKVIPETGIPHVFIHAGKLQRRWRLSTVFLLWGAIPGAAEALFHMVRFKPRVLFSTGGYVSVPVVIAAWLLRIPVIIHEQTATIGLANKIGAMFAHEVMVSFPSSIEKFPAGKVTVSGNPVRREVIAAVHKRVKRAIPKSPLRIYITGGAQGAHVINKVVLSALPELLKKYIITLQCGDNRVYKDYEAFSEKIDTLSISQRKRIRIHKYIGAVDIASVFENADLVIGRAGANTVTEVMALGVPAIFVPIPWVVNREQDRNAKILSSAGSALLINQDDLSKQTLLEGIEEVFSHYRDYYERAQQASSMAKINAADILAKKILTYARS